MQVTFRIKDEDVERIQRIAPRFNLTRYEIHRRLFLVGLAQVESGVDLFNPGGADRVVKLLEERFATLLAAADRNRARDFNLAIDNLEFRVWLRTLGEVLVPESQAKVDELIKEGLQRFLSTFEHLPVVAPALKS
jgi:hypothetical protein